MMWLLQDAWISAWHFAAHAHRGQKVPGTELPYIVHLGSVAMEILVAHQIEPFENPSLAVQCALLHDTLEDTGSTQSMVLSLFGTDVTAGVVALTKDRALSKSEAMADSLRRIREQRREVWAVKMADRITNLGPPPPSWTAEKIDTYRLEASSILNALGQAHESLAARLSQRIAAYPPRAV